MGHMTKIFAYNGVVFVFGSIEKVDIEQQWIISFYFCN